ncbi:MAG: alpha/beta hydrolase family protein [Chitinophagaceae bacterium]
MFKYLLIITAFCISFNKAVAQKKPLDHSVYNDWQSLGERKISNNGKVVVYTVQVQEGDNTLYIQTANSNQPFVLPRGYDATITHNSEFVVCKIKPLYNQTRDARIKKKKADEMPKDSLAIFQVSNQSLTKLPMVKSYALGEKGGDYLVYLKEKITPVVAKSAPPKPDSLKVVEQLKATIDSLTAKLQNITTKGLPIEVPKQAAPTTTATKDDPIEEGTTLVIRNLTSGKEMEVALVSDYNLHKNGEKLLLKTTKSNTKKTVNAHVLLYQFTANKFDTLLSVFNDVKLLTWDEAGKQVAFVAERDSAAKALTKYYQLYYYNGADTAKMLATRNTKGMPEKWTISENSGVAFSKSGSRLFVGIAPILPPKDTTLPEFERVNVDVWHHKDDYLQTVQLYNLNRDLRKAYMALFSWEKQAIVPLENKDMPNVIATNDGDGNFFYGIDTKNKRVASQWQGFVEQDIYAIDMAKGDKKLVMNNFKGSLYPSPAGSFLLLYQEKKRAYVAYEAATGNLNKVATDIKFPLYDEENDVPDDPNAYGIAKWVNDNDANVIIYDKYDWYKVDLTGKTPAKLVTFSGSNFSNGRKQTQQLRFVETDREQKYLTAATAALIRSYNTTTKQTAFYVANYKNDTCFIATTIQPLSKTTLTSLVKAKQANSFVFAQESYQQSPNLYWQIEKQVPQKLTETNPQQANYNWGTAELYTWKAYDGKKAEGIVYKPENFEKGKKYPMIVYFYERNNQTLYNYQAPAPTPSRLNISFFVSRGYIVFVPDIWYIKGYPGKSAYNYIVSGTRALVKEGWVDSTKIGLQGQSWGGYQTAYLITQTKLYAAAWAGAPVTNMFSAYGGIRWESGLNRQFQYEQSQSRIGATMWERPDLYTANSPQFFLPKVTTPLVIMHNDADGAVPWYQGIELFTGLRRLQKPVWMLNYNGEAHNLVDRKNRKDIQIREQQFFDWLLKGEKPAPWLVEGVPAIMKGRTMGL